MNNIINEKINFLEEELKKYNYILEEEEIQDLKYRLNSKPVQLYLRVIECLYKNNEEINYKNIKKLIKLDIRIRDNIRKVITALEECIRVKYIDQKGIGFNNFDDFDKAMKENLCKVINNIKNLDEKEQNLLHKIRVLRNKTSHIVYPIISDEFIRIINDIKSLEVIDFVKKRVIHTLLKIIYGSNNKIELIFFYKLIRQYEEN